MIGAVLSPNWDMWSLSKMRCVMSANVGGDDHESSNSCEQARKIRQNSREAPGNHVTEEMICPCCSQPHLKRMVVLECSNCGFRKTESEAQA